MSPARRLIVAANLIAAGTPCSLATLLTRSRPGFGGFVVERRARAPIRWHFGQTPALSVWPIDRRIRLACHGLAGAPSHCSLAFYGDKAITSGTKFNFSVGDSSSPYGQRPAWRNGRTARDLPCENSVATSRYPLRLPRPGRRRQTRGPHRPGSAWLDEGVRFQIPGPPPLVGTTLSKLSSLSALARTMSLFARRRLTWVPLRLAAATFARVHSRTLSRSLRGWRTSGERISRIRRSVPRSRRCPNERSSTRRSSSGCRRHEGILVRIRGPGGLASPLDQAARLLH